MKKWKKFDLMDHPEKVKEFLKRDAIIYTEFEKRCEAISAYFGNERFGLYEMLREFVARADDASMIERIERLNLIRQEREAFQAKEPELSSTYNEIDSGTSGFEKYFNVNYAPLDILENTGQEKYRHVFQWAEDFFNDPEPIGEAKKIYSIGTATKALGTFYAGEKHFTDSYLNLPVITPRGRMGTSSQTALVQIDFSKPDEEITDLILTIKREYQKNPAPIKDLDHFLDQRLLPQKCSTAEEIWGALRSHEKNGGKGLATRWADMLFIYDCRQYFDDKPYVVDEINRYWHKKNPLINPEAYGNAIFCEELKAMFAADFNQEPDAIQAKYKKNGVTNWAKYGLSRKKKTTEIKKMLQASWDQESPEIKFQYSSRKIHPIKTYDRDHELIRAMMDEGKITKFMFGIDLSERTKYRNSIPPQTYKH